MMARWLPEDLTKLNEELEKGVRALGCNFFDPGIVQINQTNTLRREGVMADPLHYTRPTAERIASELLCEIVRLLPHSGPPTP